MRILQIAPPWFAVPPSGYGGTERVVSSLTEGLVARGHDVTLLASGGSVTAARLWTVFDEPPRAALGSPAHDLRHCLYGYRRRLEFDVVHDHSSVVTAAVGSMTTDVPVVHTVHGAWVDEVAAAFAALPPSLHLVAISRDHAARAPKDVRIAEVVRNGIEVGRFPFRADRRTGDGYLAFVGRVNPNKGPEVAVEVARRLGRPLRMALKVNEPEEHRHWERAVRPRLEDACVEVTMNGTAEEAFAVMAGADVTLAPLAWDEPFGLVLAESMACGTSVVAYERGAAREVIAHAETGFLVAPGDVDGLCDAVVRAPSISPRACRDRVERVFSADRMVEHYEALYERVLASRPPADPPVRLADAVTGVPALGGL